MKTRIALVAAIITLGCTAVDAQERRVRAALETNSFVVWVGLDYSKMKIIANTNAQLVPDMIFQGMPAKWNDLFLDERIEEIASAFKKQFRVDISFVTEANAQLNRKQLEYRDGAMETRSETHIKPEDIKRFVADYKLESERGLGLVFIIDRFVSEYIPATDSGKISTPARRDHWEALYVVWFDIATREVLSTRRELHGRPDGRNYRNSWFGPIKDVDSELTRYQ